MSEMVERVAKAIVEAGCGTLDNDLSQVYMGGSDYTIDCLKLARAAIKAMHEFPSEMAEAGREAFNWHGDGFQEDANRMFGGSRVFHAMIDAALKE